MPSVSALHCNLYNLYIGLVTGEILIMNTTDLSLLTTLHCHRSHVHSFLPINLMDLLPQSNSPAFTPAVCSSGYPFLVSAGDTTNDVKYKSGPVQLMSFGTGFR